MLAPNVSHVVKFKGSPRVSTTYDFEMMIGLVVAELILKLLANTHCMLNAVCAVVILVVILAGVALQRALEHQFNGAVLLFMASLGKVYPHPTTWLLQCKLYYLQAALAAF